MITKFISTTDEGSVVEFSRYKESLFIETQYPGSDTHTVVLGETELFSLIGHLLRVQSEIRKEASK